jgi:hypothetical protein
MLSYKAEVADMKYTVIIEKGRESGYVAYAPALKGCVYHRERPKPKPKRTSKRPWKPILRPSSRMEFLYLRK